MKNILLYTFVGAALYANSCPKWTILSSDDISIVVPIYDNTITEPDLDCDGIIDSEDNDIDGDGFSNNVEEHNGTDAYNAQSYPTLNTSDNNADDTSDTIDPDIIINGDNPMILTEGDTFNDPGATVDPDVNLTVESNVDTSSPGKYSVTYTAVDQENHQSIATREVVVVSKEIASMHQTFDKYYNNIKRDTIARLDNGNVYALYDLQTYLQAAAIYADQYHDTYMLKKLLDLVSIPFDPKYLGKDDKWFSDAQLPVSQFMSLTTRVLSACERNGIDTTAFHTPKTIDGHTYDNLKIIEKHILKWVKTKSEFYIADKVHMKFRFKNDGGALYFVLWTEKGKRVLVYNNEKTSRGRFGKYSVHIGLGDSFNSNQWILFDRNITKDLEQYDSNNTFLYGIRMQFDGADVDIKSLSMNTYRNNEFLDQTVPYRFTIDKGFKNIWVPVDPSNSHVDVNKDENGDNYLALRSDDLDRQTLVKMIPFNKEDIWDAPTYVSDFKMFVFQSILAFDDYMHSIGEDYNPDYKVAYLKGLMKNIKDSFIQTEPGYFAWNLHKRAIAYQNKERHRFPSYNYSGYGTEVSRSDMFGSDGYTTLEPKTSKTGEDVSHNRRLNWLIETIETFGEPYGLALPEDIIDGYANTIADKVCIGSEDDPHFTIYADGTNHWYRVNYGGNKNFGYDPSTHDMDKYFVSASYRMLSDRRPKIDQWLKAWIKKHNNQMQTSYYVDYLFSNLKL